MKKITKICLSILTIDAVVYLILFHSGIVLPFINPTVEEYNAMNTSFPRDYAQAIYWIVAHYPSSVLISLISERFLVLSTAQTPLIIYGVNWLVRKLKNKKHNQRIEIDGENATHSPASHS